MSAIYAMNKHPMMTRSKSKNNLLQQPVEQTDYNENIKKKIESLISDILNYDISQPAFVPVLVIIMAFTIQTLIVFIKKIFNVFDYISELEAQYFGVKYEDDQVKHVYICVAMNIIAWMVFFRSVKNEQEVQAPDVNDDTNVVPDVNDDTNVVPDNNVVPVNDDNVVPENNDENYDENVNDVNNDNVVPVNDENNDNVVPENYDENYDDEPLQYSRNSDYIENEYNESDMTDDQIETIKDIAERCDMTNEQAYQFMYSCHNCSKPVEFGGLYCCPRCQDYVEVFNYKCFRVKEGFYCRYCRR